MDINRRVAFYFRQSTLNVEAKTRHILMQCSMGRRGREKGQKRFVYSWAASWHIVEHIKNRFCTVNWTQIYLILRVKIFCFCLERGFCWRLFLRLLSCAFLILFYTRDHPSSSHKLFTVLSSSVRNKMPKKRKLFLLNYMEPVRMWSWCTFFDKLTAGSRRWGRLFGCWNKKKLIVLFFDRKRFCTASHFFLLLQWRLILRWEALCMKIGSRSTMGKCSRCIFLLNRD